MVRRKNRRRKEEGDRTISSSKLKRTKSYYLGDIPNEILGRL